MAESPGPTVKIDLALCMGTGVCASLAPQHFSVPRGQAIWHDPAGSLDAELLAEVIESCPMAAIGTVAP